MPALAPLLALLTLAAPAAPAAPSTRDLARVNWMELREWVPAKIDTVLLPLGTLEAARRDRQRVRHPGARGHRRGHRAAGERHGGAGRPLRLHGRAGRLSAAASRCPKRSTRAYVRAVLVGLAQSRFRNMILVNGHGGGQTAVLNALAQEVGRDQKVRILVVNWWSYCSDVTQEVFGEDGGHAGDNETAFIQAIDPSLVHPERYSPELTTRLPGPQHLERLPVPVQHRPLQGRPGLPALRRAAREDLLCQGQRQGGAADRGHHQEVEPGRAVAARPFRPWRTCTAISTAPCASRPCGSWRARPGSRCRRSSASGAGWAWPRPCVAST